MAVTVELPQVGESVVEGTIGKWLKQPGDVLQKYDPLVEVITDKVTMEVPAPFGGVLSRILIEEGETIPVGTAIAEVETTEVSSAPRTETSPTPANAEVGTVGYLVKDFRQVGPTGGGGGEAGSSETPDELASGDRARLSPVVRRLAKEDNVDLSKVKGTGLGGRITRDDVLAYTEAPVAAPTVVPVSPKISAIQAAGGPDEEEIALTPIRRIIAQNMVKSATEIPHAWGMSEADVTNLVRFRESIKQEFFQREGVDLTYLPFVIKAVVESLKEYPYLNSTWGGDKIILKKRVNIGIAVAAPDGLVVPVIHNADGLSISGLATAVRDLTNRARQGKLTLEDVQKGTFTVNNTGALGSVISQPIINYPQAGILTTESILKRPVVIDDAIAIRSIMNICLSFDHRIVDGAESGGFLRSVKGRLEAMGSDTPIH